MNVLYRNISKYSRNKLLLTWDLKKIKHFGYSLYMNTVFRANRSSVIWAHRSFYVSERAIRLGIKRWKNCLKKLSITNEKKKILTNRSFFERFARITSELLTSLFFKEIESDSIRKGEERKSKFPTLLVGSAPDGWVSSPGFESGISFCCKTSHCIIYCKIS